MKVDTSHYIPAGARWSTHEVEPGGWQGFMNLFRKFLHRRLVMETQLIVTFSDGGFVLPPHSSAKFSLTLPGTDLEIVWDVTRHTLDGDPRYTVNVAGMTYSGYWVGQLDRSNE